MCIPIVASPLSFSCHVLWSYLRIKGQNVLLQAVELESTIDPSHIIHLIRQLLPFQGGQPGTQECNEPIAVPTRENPQEDVTATVDIMSSTRDDNCKEPVGEVKPRQPVDNKETCRSDKICGTHNVPLRASVFREENDKVGADEDSGEEELREQAGCVLWDLAASESQADFLVKLHPMTYTDILYFID